MKNPFIIPILSILKEHKEGLPEFDIIRTLKSQFPDFSTLATDANLCLFRQHFLVMNALYQLQTQLWQDEKLKLSISPMHIQIDFSYLNKLPPSKHDEKIQGTNVNHSAEVKLANYYLDWSEYTDTDEAEVKLLLDNFFKGMQHPIKFDQAYKTLNLPKDATYSEIKKQYRSLASQAHPDKGGSSTKFIELREAFELLSHHKSAQT
ncbi:DNA-J related domain-containing protein [Marinomonas sp. 2405UD68-3]|uniref:DNA-J related domain-containing protein n=1 Tax=Marinomonas sp. 2405UD68-3 TaxID=3391835 RepID=UPI0039C94E43